LQERAALSGSFDKSLEETVSVMVHAHEQLLVSLNTNREPIVLTSGFVQVFGCCARKSPGRKDDDVI